VVRKFPGSDPVERVLCRLPLRARGETEAPSIPRKAQAHEFEARDIRLVGNRMTLRNVPDLGTSALRGRTEYPDTPRDWLL
jgi:hypothetical protein